MKNKIIISFWAGFSVGLVSQCPPVHTKWISTSPAPFGEHKITFEGNDEDNFDGAILC
jgi:hypothetical protein